jgi:hypothetical protein
VNRAGRLFRDGVAAFEVAGVVVDGFEGAAGAGFETLRDAADDAGEALCCAGDADPGMVRSSGKPVVDLFPALVEGRAGRWSQRRPEISLVGVVVPAGEDGFARDAADFLEEGADFGGGVRVEGEAGRGLDGGSGGVGRGSRFGRRGPGRRGKTGVRRWGTASKGDAGHAALSSLRVLPTGPGPKSMRASASLRPRMSMRLRSVEPRPASSASLSGLSPRTKGAWPRVACGE